MRTPEVEVALDRQGTPVAIDDWVRLHPESRVYGSGERLARIVQVHRGRVFGRTKNSDRRVELRSPDFTKET